MPRLFIGLMSGTSLDGVDAVVAAFDAHSYSGNADDRAPRLLRSHYQPFSTQLRDALLALQATGVDELHRAAIAANQLSEVYATAVRALLMQSGLDARDIAAIGCHGQTVRHRPDAGYTTQLVNAALLAESTGIAVVSDFRSRDIAAGGQGAPLVPAFHRRMFHTSGEHRVIVNIGGIANLSNLPPAGAATGFDCGPGNALMDEWICLNLGRDYDAEGGWAASGVVLRTLLDALMAHDFFSLPPPKSTGRDVFNLAWVQRALGGSESPCDVQATLLEVTVRGIALGIQQHCAGAQAIFVCGGGAHNCALMTRLAALLPGTRIAHTGVLGVDADWVEAFAFAWLARQFLQREAGNLPEVTGAKGARVLGALYPV